MLKKLIVLVSALALMTCVAVAVPAENAIIAAEGENYASMDVAVNLTVVNWIQSASGGKPIKALGLQPVV